MASSEPIPLLRVLIGSSPTDRQEFTFRQPFRIGRSRDCEVRIQSEFVSRAHASVAFEDRQWWVVDAGSFNGLFVDGQRVARAPIAPALALRLGVQGPFVWFQVEGVPPAAPSVAERGALGQTQAVVAKYFGDRAEDEPAGEHTRLLRRAYRHVQTKQRRRYGGVIATLVVLALGIAGFAAYQYQQARQQKALAQDIFYAMKALDVDIAGLEKLVLASTGGGGAEQIKRYRERRQEMERSYDRFLSALHVYDAQMKESERLLLRIARVFGECELTMPADFAAEVEGYIKRWQSSGRFARAIRTAQEKGYTLRIAEELLARGLPPQFFYLAMQESDFDALASGPPTYKGIAKGMWQFIPETAVKYELKLGPLVDLRRPDPGDDRHHWEKETRAAVRYLKDLYASEAQASGLLVMASYNWGEHRVIPLIQSLPANPRERNYWKLLAAYRDKIPKETYDYVFYIVAAAVIGENPRLFGFDFDNPLGYLEQK
jgi:membrane-bound lytic murein transglycosylase D